MSNSMKVLIYSRNKDVDETEYCKPITVQFFNDISKIKTVITSASSSAQYVVLFVDQPHQYDVEEIQNNNNVAGTLICNNPTDNVRNLQNVLRISENLRAYKVAFYSMNVYLALSNVLIASNQKDLGEYFQTEAIKQFQWLKENIQRLACHILLIPLNTNRNNLVELQCALLEMCKKKWNDKEILVCTLYDYILFEESELGIINSSDGLGVNSPRELRETVINLILQIAPIRIYVPGNERAIVHGPSRLLIARERNTNPEGKQRYIDRCTFLECEPVDPSYRSNLADYLGTKWQLDASRTVPIRIEAIAKDPNFILAVEHIYKIFSERKAHTELAVCMPRENFHQIMFSEKFRPINEAETYQIDEDSNPEMDFTLRTYQKSPSNDCSEYELHSIDQAQNCQKDDDEDFSVAMDDCMQRDYRKSPQNE